MKEDLIRHLTKLNFSEQEAMVYLCLLEDSPATGYAISQRTKIPRSHIYEVLESLRRKGCVMVSKSTPPQYAAVPYRQYLDRYAAQRNTNRSLTLQAAKDYMATEAAQDVIWNLFFNKDILNTADRLIRESKNYILLKLWAQEADVLAPSLAEAQKRGVRLYIITFGTPKTSSFSHYTYELTADMDDSARQLKGEFDGMHVLYGELSDVSHSFASWTSNPILKQPIHTALVYDLSLANMYKADSSGSLLARFGADLAGIRSAFGSRRPNDKEGLL